MPKLDEFFNKETLVANDSTFEELPGKKPCSKCDIDVDGGLWDFKNLIMKWTCSNGHETIHKVG
jgi:hypothetical protein